MTQNIRNKKAYAESFWNWQPFNVCFPGTKIRITDLDGMVERNGFFLLLETKGPGVPVPLGQSIMFERLVVDKGFAVMILWGRQVEGMPPEVERFEVWVSDKAGGKTVKAYDTGGLDRAVWAVREWFKFANKEMK